MWGHASQLHRASRILLRRSSRRCWRQLQPRWTSTNTTTNTNSNSIPWHRHDHPFMVGKLTPKLAGGHSLSEIAGNLSFVGVCIAYLHTDILMLRLLSMGSIALSIVFQYYRAMPLWIPIRWNVLLLGINSIMTLSLVVERNRADNMGARLETIYTEGYFQDRGFSRVEFLRLFEKARVVTMEPGERLAEDGKVNRKLYFITEGQIHIERQSKQIAAVTPNHFIGEMTFLNYLTTNTDNGGGDSPESDDAGTMATADAIVDAQVVAYTWDFDRLKEYLMDEREVRNALSAYMNHDLRAKLARLNRAHHRARKTTLLEQLKREQTKKKKHVNTNVERKPP